MVSYYNENDPYCAEWLRNLCLVGLLPEGDVDDRSISEVDPSDLIGYDQCHFFAGVAGWPLALQLAGWPDDREVWTGSCPCQPFSGAGKRGGTADPRHLWPDFFALIRARRPAIGLGEQVSSALGRAWFDGVRSDLESIAYVTRAVDIPACSVNAPHIRNRLWWLTVADDGCIELPGERSATTLGAARETVREVRDERFRADAITNSGHDGIAVANDTDDTDETERRRRLRRSSESDSTVKLGTPSQLAGHCNSNLGISDSPSCSPGSPAAEAARYGHSTIAAGGSDSGDLGDSDSARHPLCGILGEFREPQRGTIATTERTGSTSPAGYWDEYDWIACADGKQRRVKPGVHLLVNGSTARIPRIRASGNAIVPALAAEIIKAWMEVAP